MRNQITLQAILNCSKAAVQSHSFFFYKYYYTTTSKNYNHEAPKNLKVTKSKYKYNKLKNLKG